MFLLFALLGLTGFISSLLLTYYGLTLTAGATPEMLSTFPELPTGMGGCAIPIHYNCEEIV